MARCFGDTHPVASHDTPNSRAQNRRVEICWKATTPEAPSNTFDRSQERKMKSSWLYRTAAVAGVSMMLSGGAALAQQGPPDCNWKKYLYAQDAVQQGKLDTKHAQPDERPDIGTRLLLDQQSPANLQWLADGGQAL